MITAQQDALATFIKEQFDVIDEFDSVSAAIKILYLTRAITCELNDFLVFLDKLYDGTNLELIGALKSIHNMAFNHKVRSGENEMPYWELWFRVLLGPTAAMPSCKDEVCRLVEEKIGEISEHCSEIASQKSERALVEASIAPNSHWRALLKLSERQLPFSIRSYLQLKELTLEELSNLTPQQWKNLSDFQVFQLVIVLANNFKVEQAMNLSEADRQKIVRCFLDNEPFRAPSFFGHVTGYLSGLFCSLFPVGGGGGEIVSPAPDDEHRR